MSRARLFKPVVCKHEGLFDLEKQTGLPMRFAWPGLWTVADKEGRFKWRPRELKADVLPFDDLDFADVLEAFRSAGFIVRYEVGGKAYGCIPTWHEHQKPHVRELESEIPPPPDTAKLAHDLGSAVRDRDLGDGDGDGSARTRKAVTEQQGIVGDCARLWSEAYSEGGAKLAPRWTGEAGSLSGLAKEHGDDAERGGFELYLLDREPYLVKHRHQLTTYVSNQHDKWCCRLPANRRTLEKLRPNRQAVATTSPAWDRLRGELERQRSLLLGYIRGAEEHDGVLVLTVPASSLEWANRTYREALDELSPGLRVELRAVEKARAAQ